MAFLAYNFNAFLVVNLKPKMRRGKPRIFWVRLISAELHSHPGIGGLDSS